MDDLAAPQPAGGLMRSRPLLIIASALIGIAVFAAFLAADFPYKDTLSSMLAPYNLKLTYESQHLSPPIGAELVGVQLFSTTGSGDEALLQSPAVTLAPTLASLLFGRPGMHVRANLYGGVVHVTVHQRSGVVNLDFSLDSLQLAQNAQLRSFGAVVKGNLSGSGAAQINGPNLPDDQATMAVNGDQIEVAIVDGYPPIHLGTLTGNLQLDQAAVKLSGIVAHGDDLDLKADGTIQLGETLDDSTINLTFYLTPTQNGLDHFGFFLKMLPHPPGPDAPFTVDGNLLSPSIS
jgi:type II secretion system protein N